MCWYCGCCDIIIIQYPNLFLFKVCVLCFCVMLPSAAHSKLNTWAYYCIAFFLTSKSKNDLILRIFLHWSQYVCLSGFVLCVKAMMTRQQQVCDRVFSHSGLGRMHQRCCATYESASLRMFRLGRTDTIRSASCASAAFVKAFDDHSKQVRGQFNGLCFAFPAVYNPN